MSNTQTYQYAKKEREFFQTIRQVLPFDDENFAFMYDPNKSNSWKFLVGYTPSNPVANAKFHSEKKRVVVKFGFCPSIEPNTEISFDAQDEREADWKMYSLIQEIMLNVVNQVRKVEVMNIVSNRLELLNNYISNTRGEHIERSEIAQVR